MRVRRASNDSDSRRYYEWMDRAQSDLQSARILLAGGGDLRSVVFHCHQVAEKSLKGYLLFKTGKHYDGHNITFLVRKSMSQDKDFTAYLDGSTPFNRYYTEARYPTDLPFDLTEAQVCEVFNLTECIYSTVASKLRYQPSAFAETV